MPRPPKSKTEPEVDLTEAAKELLSRRKATESLHAFVAQAWPQVEGGREFVDGWMLKALAEHLEAVYRGDIRNLVVNVPPRMAKSLMCNVFWPTWVWLHAPETQFLFTSYSAQLTIRDNVRARRIIESQWFQARWGDKFSLAGDQNTKIRIDNDRGGYRVTTSIDGTTTGEGADIIVCLPAWETVWTVDGPMRIGDVVMNRKKPRVLSRNDATGEFEADEIVAWEENHMRDMTRILLSDGHTLTITADHLVFSAGLNNYVMAGALQRGDMLVSPFGKRAVMAINSAPRELTYNVRIKKNRNYLAGSGAVLVHNCDDPNPPKDTSATMLESALAWWQGTMPTRMNNFKTGRKVVIQQRVHEGDITGHILKTEKKDWTALILPMELEKSRRCVTVALPSTGGKPWQDPRKDEGELLFPERIGPAELQSLKRGLGSTYLIAGQLQQRPAPEAGGMFKREWFRKWTKPETPKLEMVLTSWDTALSEKDKAAYSACTVWGVFFRQYQDEREWMQGVTPGDADALGRVPNLMLMNCIRGRWEYPELRRMMSNMAKDFRCDVLGAVPDRDRKYKPDMNLVEAKASGISVTQELNRTGEVFTKFVPDKFGDKMQRVRLITHLVEAGRIWLPCRLDGELKGFAKLLLDQCLLFPNAESRDIVDTMTQALLRLQYSGWIAHPEDPGEPADMAPESAEPLY